MTKLQKLRGHDGLSWYMDGDATVIVRDDFVDLQASPAVFPECPSCDSNNILVPAELYPRFSCETCGWVFVPDLSDLEVTGRNEIDWLRRGAMTQTQRATIALTAVSLVGLVVWAWLVWRGWRWQ